MAHKISLMEGQEGVAQGSTVLSRVRMLESADVRSLDSVATRKNVHPFNRRSTGEDGGAIVKNLPSTSIRPEGREYASPGRPLRIPAKDGKAPARPIPVSTRISQEPMEASARHPSPTLDRMGSPLRRDDTVRTLEPAGARQTPKMAAKSPANDFRRKGPSPSGRADPDGFRGTDSRRALSESPLRHARKAPSPSRSGPMVDTSSNTLFKKLESGDKTLRSTSLPRRPISETSNRSRGEESLTRNSSAQRRGEESPARKSDAHKREESPARNKSVRKREEFLAKASGSKTRAASPASLRAKDLSVQTRAASPVPRLRTLQRHHWDKRNDGTDNGGRGRVTTNASRDDTSSATSSAGSADKNWKSKNPGIRDEQPKLARMPKRTTVQLSWPQERVEASHVTKQGSTAYSSSQEAKRNPSDGLKLHVGQTVPTIGNVRLHAAARKPGNSELRRNLNAASVIMHDEKASSVGTSSSSGRSSLSHQELGGIASRALKLSQVRANTQSTRCQNSPLHQILAAKRTRKISAEEKQAKEDPKTKSAYAYGSAARLSERLTRAERFTALKNARSKVRPHNDDVSSSSPASPASAEKSTHPVFGYSQRAFTVNTADDSSTLPPAEPSCVRRSKHLSKVMQQKADHFAACSPSRRSRNDTRDGGFQEARDSKPSKESAPERERSLAPQVNQQARSAQVIQQDVRISHKTKMTEAYRESINEPSHDKPWSQPLALPEKSGVLQPNNGQFSANGDKKQFPHIHSRFNYPPGSLSTTVQDRRSAKPIRQQPEPAFAGRPYRYDGDGAFPEETLPFSAYEKREKQSRGAGDNEEADHHMLLASKSQDENDGEGDYSDSASSSDEELSLDFARSQVVSRPIGEARGASYKAVSLRLDSVTAGISRPESSGNTNKAMQHRKISANRKAKEFGALAFASSRNLEVVAKREHPFLHETRRGSESLLLTDFSDDGPATVGEQSGHDHTFTGSLNKHEISNDSSDSSGARPDAFQWLHQKYGTQAPVVADVSMQKSISAASLLRVKSNEVKRARIFEKTKDDDDDDIFFGLEEGYADEEDGKSRNSIRSLAVGLSRIQTDRSQLEASRATGNLNASLQAGTKPVSTPKTESTERDESTKHSGKTVDAVSSEKSVRSDITSSLIADKGRKARYRPNPVETIIEEPPVGVSIDEEEDDVSLDEESVTDETKPSTSVLKDLSSAIVNSIQHACTIPGTSVASSEMHRYTPSLYSPTLLYVEEMPDLAACAMNTKLKCEEKISEAWVGLSEEEAAYEDEATKATFEPSEGGTATEDMLNDVERRIWAAWDNRDKDPSETTPDLLQAESDDLRKTSDTSSSSSNSQPQAQHHERRTEAQKQLFGHAEKAMELFGANVERYGTLSTESSLSQGPMPMPDDRTTSSRLSAALTLEQRAVLEKFSFSLKNEGVEVLKLSRWNKWQIRYLVVSREVTQLNAEQEVTGNIGQCPKALLWPKHIVKTQSNTVSSIKENGRGGVLFNRLKQVRPIESNEFYDRGLPRKLKKLFPEFAGAVVDYGYEGGERQLHFCFKTNIDAQAFVTTMLIIKDAAERTGPNKGSGKIESYPTETSGTKSFES